MHCSFDHLHFRCSNLEGSVSWFKEKLGAKEQFRREVRGNLIVGMTLGEATLLFSSPPPEGESTTTSSTGWGLWHFGLKVPNLEETITDLRNKNVKITTEPTSLPGGVKIAFIEGPDNISIEVLERT